MLWVRLASHQSPTTPHRLLLQGTSQVYGDLLNRVESGLTLFEQLCKSSIFRVPAHVLLPQVGLTKQQQLADPFIHVQRTYTAAAIEDTGMHADRPRSHTPQSATTTTTTTTTTKMHADPGPTPLEVPQLQPHPQNYLQDVLNPPQVPTTSEKEEDLDSKLDSLRHQLQQVRILFGRGVGEGNDVTPKGM